MQQDANKADQPSPLLGPHAWRSIRHKASQLVGIAGLRYQDRPDIEQELALRVWRAMPNFDPDIGCSGAFVATVIERAANSLLRLRSSRKRGIRHAHQSLAIGACMSGTGDDDTTRSARPCTVVSHETAVDLVQDVGTVIDHLPSELRELAEGLKHHSVTETARRAGISRSTIYARIGALRVAFEAAGLKNLSRSSDTSRAFCEVTR